MPTIYFYHRAKDGGDPEQVRPAKVRALLWVGAQKKRLYITTDIVLSPLDQQQKILDKFDTDGRVKKAGSRVNTILRDKLKFWRFIISEAYTQAEEAGKLETLTSAELTAIADNVRHKVEREFYKAAAIHAAEMGATYTIGAPFTDSKWSNEVLKGYIWSKRHGLFKARG